MSEQKFQKGDLVQVAKDLGKSMSHFTSGCRAIVIGSYTDRYGGDDTKSYTIYTEGRGQSSWYYEHQLTLIESGRTDLLKEWEDVRDAEIELKSNLDWIFKNGKEVINSAHGCTCQALADCFDMGSLWGSRGEGYTYMQNSLIVLGLAKPFLESGDKTGWLRFCDTIHLDKENRQISIKP